MATEENRRACYSRMSLGLLSSLCFPLPWTSLTKKPSVPSEFEAGFQPTCAWDVAIFSFPRYATLLMNSFTRGSHRDAQGCRCPTCMFTGDVRILPLPCIALTSTTSHVRRVKQRTPSNSAFQHVHSLCLDVTTANLAPQAYLEEFFVAGVFVQRRTLTCLWLANSPFPLLGFDKVGEVRRSHAIVSFPFYGHLNSSTIRCTQTDLVRYITRHGQ